MKNKFSMAMTLAVVMAMLVNSLALADNVVNNIDTTVDNAAETRTIAAGNSTVVGFFIDPTNGGGDASGCNATGADKAYGNLSVPSNVTASQTTNLEFAGCGSANAVPVTFSSSTPGTYTIRITSVTGGKPGSIWNLTTSDFNLVVSAPSDTTAPVITKTINGTLGNNGWYTSNVVVDWTVSDPQSSFTTTGCVDTTISSDTTGTTSSCSATSAGGTSSDSVTIKRDATAPSISGGASPAPNGAGWNKTDVSVTFSCSDGVNGSGIASCGPNTTLTSNGENQSAIGNAVDNAGNTASTTVSDIDIDKELPSINASVPAANANNWYNSPVTATFNCSDTYSGVATCEGPHTFNTEGSSSFTGNATDVADNANSTNVSVMIDTTAPVIALVSRTPANANGWNNSDVELEWSCTDGGSGVVASTINKVVSTEGVGQSESATCEDLAGNTSSDTQTGISIDSTDPIISAGRLPAPNANGWNNTDVAAGYSASDALSGLDLASPASGSFTFTSEGAGQSHTFTVTDLAGNSASATVDNVNIDKTAPTISGTPDRAPNSHGWYNADVVINFACTDTLSGMGTCATPSTLGEGENQSASGTATDLAGNTATSTVSGINIDKTSPSASASALPLANANGWNSTDVTVSFSGSDALSGIDFCDPAAVLSSEGAGQSASGTCTDKAGNNSAPATASGINIDKTAPTASGSASPAANINGWNNSDVTISFGGTDGLSGLDTCSVPVVLSSEAAGQSASGTCTDKAGNVSTLATVSGINIDRTSPSVNLVGGPANGGSYYFGSVPAAPTCSASDTLSGIEGSCTISGYGTGIGSHVVSTSATDKAGNSASASSTYSVLAWSVNGFYQPVDMNSGIWNTIKGGQTVPLKFEIFAGSTEFTNTSAVQSVQAYRIACTTSGGEDAIETITTGGTSLRYDATSGQFIFNWQTPRQSGTCYKVVMTAQDGSSLTAFFKLK